MTDLNIAILSAEDLIKYTRPVSSLEVALYDALALAMRDNGQAFDDLQDELNEMEVSRDTLQRELNASENEIDNLKDTIFELKELKELNAQLAGEVQ